MRRDCARCMSQPGAAAHRAEPRSAARGCSRCKRLRVPGSDQAPQRHPRRHLRIRPAGLFLLAQSAGREPHRGLRPLADAAAPAVRCRRRAAVAHATERPRRARRVAAGGVFNVTFDRETPYPAAAHLPAARRAALYPEISGSHYRCSMRFLQWHGIEQRSTQTEADVPSR